MVASAGDASAGGASAGGASAGGAFAGGEFAGGAFAGGAPAMKVFFVADASPTVNDSSVVASLTGTYKMYLKRNEKKVKKEVTSVFVSR